MTAVILRNEVTKNLFEILRYAQDDIKRAGWYLSCF